MKSILIIFCTLFLFSCQEKKNSKKQKDISSVQDTLKLSPVETQKANTDFEPAFEGQTRIAGIKTSTPYSVDIITKSLNEPWGIVELPDGRLLITENEGFMRIVNPKIGEITKKITGFPEVDDKGQGGLLGLALSPDFVSNKMIYWTYTERVAEGNHTTVAKGRLSNDEKSIKNVEVIYRASPTYDGKLHYGGRVIFDENGNLFVSIGERSDKETRDKSQDLKTSFGKIIHITTEGQAIAENPFTDQEGTLPEIYSYGHRNPQGLDLHPETGELWSNEFGPRGGDELNLIEAGTNYGWPVITYGIEYRGDKIGDPVIQQKEGMKQPIYYWDPVLSPSGMTFYKGSKIPEWKNNLFITGLSSQHIARIQLKDNKVIGEERLLEKEGQRFRDITQAKDGALYAISQGGRLYKIDKK